MALTLTAVADQSADWGPIPVAQFTAVAGSSDYVAGGYSISAASVGMRLITSVIVIGAKITASGAALTTVYFTFWNTGSSKLQFFTATSTENSADLSSYTFTLLIIGQR